MRGSSGVKEAADLCEERRPGGSPLPYLPQVTRLNTRPLKPKQPKHLRGSSGVWPGKQHPKRDRIVDRVLTLKFLDAKLSSFPLLWVILVLAFRGGKRSNALRPVYHSVLAPAVPEERTHPHLYSHLRSNINC